MLWEINELLGLPALPGWNAWSICFPSSVKHLICILFCVTILDKYVTVGLKCSFAVGSKKRFSECQIKEGALIGERDESVYWCNSACSLHQRLVVL